ncbi:hypothetical protein [Mycoplasmopsis verecunda]|uniref:C-5 cytosine-specific DNA methylase n=1 Tax=Mycoplasmopsis verecunda TaxID=171291 RepID=A0A1T4LFR9_9BACT|nr:hypothetical protein [Mycoplasmopsis verecunda]WPB54846.1 hypothetical protein SAM46_01675 [Mycoplasmopsis verecunda]SJZ53476.1 hypothetical protein SAMN02745154_00435 [Mycoplasmopsis verecunda]
MSKIIIWDLFGGGCNSLTRAIQKYNYDDKYFVYTFDVVDTHKESYRGQLNVDFQKYINIDLSQDNITKIFDELIKNKEIQKPDIITSSTLCQSFSKVLSMTGGGTCFWKQSIRGDKNSPLIERSVEEFEMLKSGFTKNLKADKQLFIKRLGEKCAINSVKLINHFKPKYWYIENPDSSMLFQYLSVNLGLKGYLNIACYGSYDFPQNKSGGFYSNIKMNLKTQRRERTYETQWEEVTKEYYDNWINQVKEKAKLGGTMDTRHVKMVDGKYYRRWYVDKGYKIGDKGHSSLKKTTMTLGKLIRGKYILKTKGDFDTRQIGEANETSHIPPLVFKEILDTFESHNKK